MSFLGTDNLQDKVTTLSRKYKSRLPTSVVFQNDRNLSYTVRKLKRKKQAKYIKVKQSHYRPGQAQVFQEVKAPRFRDNGTG
jgi:hypothetical protein